PEHLPGHHAADRRRRVRLRTQPHPRAGRPRPGRGHRGRRPLVSNRVGRAWGLAAALAAVVVILDQVAKSIVEHPIVLGDKGDVLGPLKLTLSHNEGVAFGLADGGGILLVAITLIALGVVLFLFARDPARPWMWVA